MFVGVTSLHNVAACLVCVVLLNAVYVCRVYEMFLCSADAVHNAAGYGISGLDQNGRVSWDLISNIHIWEIEARLFIIFKKNPNKVTIRQVFRYIVIYNTHNIKYWTLNY